MRRCGIILVAVALNAALTACTGDDPSSDASSSSRAAATSEAPTAELPAGDNERIDHVVDGDTIVVGDGERVRLIGIDTPETKDPREPVGCFGVEASRHTEKLLPPGTGVRLVYDVERTDRYDRTLAYVYRSSDGLFVNAALVRDGYAYAYTYPPDVAHADELVALQREAREAGRGLWSACPVEGGGSDSGGGGAAGGTGGGTGAGGECDPAYPDSCIPSPPPDLDCADVSERRFTVLPADPHSFDADGNGLGCEGP